MLPLYGTGALAELRAGTLAPHRVLACIVGYATEGSPYIYGGDWGGEGGWDCSGSILWAHYLAGVRPNPHDVPASRLTAQGIFNTYAKMQRASDVLPGDVACYGSAVHAVSHVALVLEVNAFGSPLAVLSASNGNPNATDPARSLRERRYLRIFRKTTDAHLYRTGFLAFVRMPDPP